jgi:DNA-binding GntR family transcriptional regulator
MTQIEREIFDTLLELERAAAQMAASTPKPDLRPLFARLDELAGRLPAGADSDLRHYLQRKSYQKARAFLEQR